MVFNFSQRTKKLVGGGGGGGEEGGTAFGNEHNITHAKERKPRNGGDSFSTEQYTVHTKFYEYHIS